MAIDQTVFLAALKTIDAYLNETFYNAGFDVSEKLSAGDAQALADAKTYVDEQLATLTDVPPETLTVLEQIKAMLDADGDDPDFNPGANVLNSLAVNRADIDAAQTDLTALADALNIVNTAVSALRADFEATVATLQTWAQDFSGAALAFKEGLEGLGSSGGYVRAVIDVGAGSAADDGSGGGAASGDGSAGAGAADDGSAGGASSGDGSADGGAAGGDGGVL